MTSAARGCDETRLPPAGPRVPEPAPLYAPPLAGTTVAVFGADIVQVEPPGEGFRRDTPVRPVAARGRGSARLDVRDPAGRTAPDEPDVLAPRRAAP